MSRLAFAVDAGYEDLGGEANLIVPALAAYLKSQLKKVRVATYVEPEVFRVITD